MKKVLYGILLASLMVFVTACKQSNAAKGKSLFGKKVEAVEVTPYPKFPVDKTVHSTASVSDTCAAMEQTGFKTIRGIPCDAENVNLVVKNIDGKEYKAIEYTGTFRGTYVAASKFSGTRLEELQAVLAGKLDLAVFGGGWLPPRTYGPALEFTYGKSGANPKVTKVATLNDGRVILQVTQDGISPYFAVETSKQVSETKQVVITDYATPEVCGEKAVYSYRVNAQILKDQDIPADAKIKVIGNSKELVGECYLVSRTLQITWKEAKTVKMMTSYPYYE